MDVLEKLWYGNLCPSEQSVISGGEYAGALGEVEQTLKRLEPTLTPEQKTAIEQLLDAQTGAGCVAEKDAFVKGFCMGAHILMAVMTEK